MPAGAFPREEFGSGGRVPRLALRFQFGNGLRFWEIRRAFRRKHVLFFEWPETDESVTASGAAIFVRTEGDEQVLPEREAKVLALPVAQFRP